MWQTKWLSNRLVTDRHHPKNLSTVCVQKQCDFIGKSEAISRVPWLYFAMIHYLISPIIIWFPFLGWRLEGARTRGECSLVLAFFVLKPKQTKRKNTTKKSPKPNPTQPQTKLHQPNTHTNPKSMQTTGSRWGFEAQRARRPRDGSRRSVHVSPLEIIQQRSRGSPVPFISEWAGFNVGSMEPITAGLHGSCLLFSGVFHESYAVFVSSFAFKQFHLVSDIYLGCCYWR